jgi:hypothetical protein
MGLVCLGPALGCIQDGLRPSSPCGQAALPLELAEQLPAVIADAAEDDVGRP